jgi:uncharacterized protein (DUF849 family)
MYKPEEQIEQMKRLAPHCLSCGLRELIKDQTDYAVGHVRVGFENNLLLPDSSLAPDNAALVKLTSKLAHKAGRSPSDKKIAESLHGLGT